MKMIDREKVIKGLKAHGYTDCKYCPYWGTGHNGLSECTQLARDALALLEAQEPVIHGRWKDNGNGTVSCNCCATWFPKIRESQLQFCGYCGAKMDE